MFVTSPHHTWLIAVTSNLRLSTWGATKAPLRTTLALLVAGEVNFSDRDVSWLPDWVLSTVENCVEINPREWLEGFLPYAYSVITYRDEANNCELNGLRQALTKLSYNLPPMDKFVRE